MRQNNRPAWQWALLTALIAAAVLLTGWVAQSLAGGAANATSPSPQFNRVMTRNRNACYPVAGMYYDWVELANNGTTDISLRGWRLADSLDLREGYVFQDAVIPAGGTLIVYCAGRPGDAPETAIFTGFGLDSDGEYLILADPSERLVDTLTVPAMPANWVYARSASGEWAQAQMAPEASGAVTLDTSALRLNEVMVKNHSTLSDSDGDYSDWIELYNAGSASVNLEGFSLSDIDGKPRWQFPEMALGAGEYLVVFASGKNRREPSGELHTSFSLSASDVAVHLYNPENVEISRIACDTEEADVSISRTGDGTVTRLWPATPGYCNSESGMPNEMPLLTQNTWGLYINELMNVAGDADWAELANTGATDLDLSGMGLSDNPAHPRKWQFPAGTVIPSGGCLLIALSGGGDATQAACIADFGLSSGETLCLSLADGTIIDRIHIYALPVGVSYGRADAEARYRYFAEPTPGAPNAAQSYAKQTAQVTFSQRGGLRDEASLTVALSSDPGASIYYTLDGSEPTAGSNLYREPLNLTASATVRAVAWQEGALPSASAAATYLLGERHEGVYTVCVSGNYDDLIGPSGALNTGLKRDDCDVYVEIYDADGAPLIAQACNLKISGHSSREKYAQKAFRLKARSAYGDNRFRAKLFSNRDGTVFKAITLRASGQDNQETHIRDSVLSTLAADTGVMYLESEVAVVYINGQYWGLYNLRERVTADAIAQREGWDNADDIIIVRNGEREQGSLSTYKALMEWIARADLSTDAALEQLRRYVDVENYLDYVALEMYTCNLDLSNMRCYCNPEANGKWKWIFYDLDLSYKVDRNMARDWLIPGGVGTITQQDNTLFIKLMENDDMRDAFLSRMGELLRTTFSPERVIERFESRRALIAPEMQAHCARWGWSIDKWQTACDKFVAYAQARPEKLVEYITQAFALTEEESRAYFGQIQ